MESGYYLFVVNVAKSNTEPFDVRIGSTRAAAKEQIEIFILTDNFAFF